MKNRLGNETQDAIIKLIEDRLKDPEVDQESYFFKEGDFAEELHISRSKCREAISSLEIRGYVKRVHGRGIRAINRSIDAVSNSISDLLIRNNFNYHEIITLRKIIEVQGAGIAAEKRKKKNLTKLKKYLDIMNDTVSYKKYLEADLLFHKEIINATQNSLLSALINAYSRVIGYAIEISTDENYRPEPEQKHHKKIYEAIEEGNRVASEAYMDAHLNASMNNVGALKKTATISW